jgi:hypothetical protein
VFVALRANGVTRRATRFPSVRGEKVVRVQLLATALPGFRDLRAPLIAGYLWLIFLWILIKPDIHKRPINGVAAAVYDLAKDAGPIWIGRGVGVAAYLIGSVSQALSAMIGHKALPKFVEGVWNRVPGPWGKFLPFPEFNLVQPYMEDAVRKAGGAESLDSHAMAWLSAFGALGAFGIQPRSDNPEVDRIFDYANAATRGLNAELDLPATLLLTEPGRERDPQLFSEADRLKAERELRLAVVPPLCAIVIFIGWNQSSWWWFALIPVAVLLWQAHSRNYAFRSLMFGALERGLARSSSIDEFKRWVEALPDPSSEQQADEGSPDSAPRE